MLAGEDIQVKLEEGKHGLPENVRCYVICRSSFMEPLVAAFS